ncbi:hypothetical protein [Actinoplanes sp. NPDC049316]|uniref:hypothetical protein n=1 Tax=Actinoplanes sp. NPDC049316 TaxID=3154727 RepID=UPI003420EC86
MEFAAGPPSQWVVTLKSGAVIHLAADAYGEQEDHAVFSVLANASAEEQREIQVLAAPMAGTKVDFLVARIPLSEIAKVAGGWSWSAELSG